MPAEVALHLLDPGGVVRIARRLKLWVAVKPEPSEPWPQKVFVFVDSMTGELGITDRGRDACKVKHVLLGVLTWQRHHQRFSVRGLLLENIFDELHDVFAERGIKVVLRARKGNS